jgi:hypothetical protein
MKANKKGMIEIPQVTLNALKNMLFNNEGGTDLSAIINDIALNEDSKDLIAINVALAHKGIDIEIDKRTHYVYDWNNRFYAYEFVGFSLILGLIKTKKVTYEIDENNNINEMHRNDEVLTFDYVDWCRWSTDVNDMIDEYNRRKQK